MSVSSNIAGRRSRAMESSQLVAAMAAAGGGAGGGAPAPNPQAAGAAQQPPAQPDTSSLINAQMAASASEATAQKQKEHTAKLQQELERMKNEQKNAQSSMSNLIKWGNDNPKDFRQAVVIGFIVILALVLIGYMMFGPGADCNAIGQQYMENIDAKIDLHGFVIAFKADLTANDNGNMVTIATSDDVKDDSWLKTNAIELRRDSGAFVLSLYGNSVDSPGNDSVEFNARVGAHGPVEIRVIAFEGFAAIRIIQSGHTDKYEIKPFKRLTEELRFRYMNVSNGNRTKIGKVDVYSLSPKNSKVDTCYN